MIKFRLFLVLIGFNSLLFGQGQYFNQQFFPLGDESALLANSGIAGQSPYSAAIFNPAALVLNENNSFSFSGNAYYEFDYEAPNVLNSGNQSFSLEASGFQVMPTSLLYHLKKKDWHLSLALSSPVYLNYDGLNRFVVDQAATPYTVNTVQNSRESMYSGYLGIARKIGEGWSLGLSIYGNYYHLLSQISSQTYLNADPSNFFSSESRKEANSYSLGFMLGLLKQWEDLRWGLNLSSASIDFYSDGEIYSFSASGGLNPNLTESLTTDINTHLSNGARLGTGLEYDLFSNLSLSVDFNYFLAQSQALFPQEEIGPSSWRLSSGINLQSNPNFNYYLGFAFLPDTESDVQRQTRIFTAGSRFRVGKTLNTVGFFFTNLKSNLPSEIRLNFFGILIGSSVDLNL